MPASMISAPTGGRPNVIGSSMATVAMVPIPGSTPTSVPTSAPIRQSRMLTGIGIDMPPRNDGVHGTSWKTTLKPRPRFERRSPITPSPDHKFRQHLQRQAERVGKQQAAEDRQTNADDDGLGPFRFRGADRRDEETCKSREDHAHWTNGDRKGKNAERDEQRTTPVVGGQFRAVDQKAYQRDGYAEQKQQYPEHPRRGTGTERETAHPLQIAR